ncbi:prolipoprotein diacylglyceryl transferase family protein, partial [Clostridioides difficile]
PEHCRKCKIKDCVCQKGLFYCFECFNFPCKLIKNLEKSYNKSLAGYIYTKIKNINFLKMADTVILGMPLAQAIGRWGNFINGEA